MGESQPGLSNREPAKEKMTRKKETNIERACGCGGAGGRGEEMITAGRLGAG